MTLKIGVIGAGVMGADHIRTISGRIARAQVAAIFDQDPARAKASAAEAGGAEVMLDPHALIASGNVDAVLVASPDETHMDFTLAAIAAGKPVLCEKPLAPTTAECVRVVEAERATGKRLVQVGFMRRFDPAYEAMKARFAAGDLGEALMLHCAHRNATVPPFFRALMAITNSAVHDFDITGWLLGAKFTSIEVRKPRPTRMSAIQDPMFILLETDQGQLVDVEVFVNAQYGYDIRTELVCERGTINMIPPVHADLRADGRAAIPFAPDWRPRFADAYRRQIQAFVDNVNSSEPVGATAMDGLVATVIAEAGIRSFETGERVKIELPQL